MRSNWAGETGAVAIYRGSQAALGRISCPAERADLDAFVSEHVASEEAHLRAMSAVVAEPRERSWMPATAFGFMLGYSSTAARGARGMYITTQAVETFVEEHYGDQIQRLEAEIANGERLPKEDYEELLALLRAACADEVHHKEDAARRLGALSMGDRLQFTFVYWGSSLGAAVAKRV